jgi:AcrR family transcriptional regulator
MGTRERRQREFAEREEQFLEQARSLICQDGLLNLQMAKVAKACDYATGTLYQHFASKEDLLLALNSHLVCQRVALFKRAADWDAGSRERIFAIALGDVLFARQFPEHFRLMQYVFTDAVWHAASRERRQQALEAGRPLGTHVGRIVDDALSSGDLVSHGFNAYELVVGNWTMTQGMHTLVHADGLLQMYDIKAPYHKLLMHVNLLLNGMGWQPLAGAWDIPEMDAQIQRIHDTIYPDLTLNVLDNTPANKTEQS